MNSLTFKGNLAKRREYDMIKQTEEVCIYLWDNYIEYVAYDFLLGGFAVGDCTDNVLQDRRR